MVEKAQPPLLPAPSLSTEHTRVGAQQEDGLPPSFHLAPSSPLSWVPVSVPSFPFTFQAQVRCGWGGGITVTVDGRLCNESYSVGSCGHPTERVQNHKLSSTPLGIRWRENRRGSGEGRPPGGSSLGGSLLECGFRVGCVIELTVSPSSLQGSLNRKHCYNTKHHFLGASPKMK